MCSLFAVFVRIYMLITTSFCRDAIVSWIKKKIGPGIYNITSVEDAERILTSETKVAVGYLNSLVVSSLGSVYFMRCSLYMLAFMTFDWKCNDIFFDRLHELQVLLYVSGSIDKSVRILTIFIMISCCYSTGLWERWACCCFKTRRWCQLLPNGESWSGKAFPLWSFSETPCLGIDQEGGWKTEPLWLDYYLLFLLIIFRFWFPNMISFGWIVIYSVLFLVQMASFPSLQLLNLYLPISFL